MQAVETDAQKLRQSRVFVYSLNWIPMGKVEFE